MLHYLRAKVGELANNAIIIGMHGPGEGYEPFKLDFSIKSSECRGAKGPFPDKCTNLYYYEQDVQKKVMGEIDEKGKDGTLSLEFHKDYLDKDKKLSPHYLKAKEGMTAAEREEDNKSGGLSFVPFGEGPPLYLKEFTFTASASNQTKSEGPNLPPVPIKEPLIYSFSKIRDNKRT